MGSDSQARLSGTFTPKREKRGEPVSRSTETQSTLDSVRGRTWGGKRGESARGKSVMVGRWGSGPLLQMLLHKQNRRGHVEGQRCGGGQGGTLRR